MADIIFIRDLELETIIGTLNEERTKKQRVIINLAIYTDLSTAGVSDDLNDSVNYSLIEHKVKETVEQSSFFLLEKLAQSIADVALSFGGIERVMVEIDKPNAPYFARSIAIKIDRRKGE